VCQEIWSPEAASVQLTQTELALFLEGARLDQRLPLSPREIVI
jgi:hypothetical protein